MKSSIVILFFVLMAGIYPLMAEPVSLVNKSGSEMEAEILSAGEGVVEVRRKSDGRVFTLKTEDLSQDSSDLVNAWRKKEAERPTQPMEFELNFSKTKAKIQFLVPEGKYTPFTAGWQVSARFPSGKLLFDVADRKESLLETKQKLLDGEAAYRKKLSEEEVEKRKHEFHLVLEKFGDFEGYVTEGNGPNYGRFSNGRNVLIVYLKTSERGPIQRSHLPAIISSIKISGRGKRK